MKINKKSPAGPEHHHLTEWCGVYHRYYTSPTCDVVGSPPHRRAGGWKKQKL